MNYSQYNKIIIYLELVSFRFLTTNNLWTLGMLQRDILLTNDLQQKHQLVDFESKPWERLENIASNRTNKQIIVELQIEYDVIL